MTATVRELATRRAREEREAVEWAVETLDRIRRRRDVDLEPLVEYARRSRKSLPERHRRAYEAMAETFDVDPDVYEVYVFAFGELCEELAETGGTAPAEPSGQNVESEGGTDGDVSGSGGEGLDPSGNGCTNVLVSPPNAEADGSLILKNRDIAGRGVRPKAVVEQPPTDDHYGFLTVDTCGTVMLYKGVNDRGLVAANTYIDAARDDVTPENQLRNGTIIRMLLEECATVAEARRRLESYPTRRLMGQTLFLADGTDAVLLEVNPSEERITADDDRLVVRTNHFVDGPSPDPESSHRRRNRALELLGGDADARTRIDRADLWSVAADHANGPGDDSICRHPEPETGAHAFGQLTTASAAIFEGGKPRMDVAMGNPCEAEAEVVQCSPGGEIPSELRTGRRWLDRFASDPP